MAAAVVVGGGRRARAREQSIYHVAHCSRISNRSIVGRPSYGLKLALPGREKKNVLGSFGFLSDGKKKKKRETAFTY